MARSSRPGRPRGIRTTQRSATTCTRGKHSPACCTSRCSSSPARTARLPCGGRRDAGDLRRRHALRDQAATRLHIPQRAPPRRRRLHLRLAPGLDPATESWAARYFSSIKGADDVIAGTTTELPGLSARDDHTLVVDLKKPDITFIGQLSQPYAAALPKEEVERLGEQFGRTPVGNGPFMITSYDPRTRSRTSSATSTFRGPDCRSSTRSPTAGVSSRRCSSCNCRTATSTSWARG